MLQYLGVTIFLIIIILLYFKIAVHYNIVDIPNHRSSHAEVTIRGAGVVFPLAACIGLFMAGGQTPWLLLTGLVLISGVSFIDDLKDLSTGVRFSVHLLSASLMFYALGLYTLWPVWLIILAYLIATAAVNAFNFMDGINGITGIYILVALLSMLFVNTFIINFGNNALIICPAIACIVFLFFNFRNKARCFAGDAGSIGIAFWLMTLSVIIINKTGDFKYLFFFSVYGIDVLFTIIKRLMLKQNVFQAHRMHIYQLLVNNGNFSHRQIALAYGLAQLVINVFVLTTQLAFGIYLLIITAVLSPLYLILQKRFNDMRGVAPLV